jgi:hypothetical protein
MRVAAFALFCVVSTSVGLSAQSGSNWTLATTTDKMTDKSNLTASVRSKASPNSPYVYELSLKCDGRERAATIGTYEESSGEAREIPWKTTALQGYALGPITSLGLRLRIDDASPDEDYLKPVYTNVGRITSFLDSMPAKRLVIADVFPDEQVEFRFDSLSAQQRTSIHNACFLAAERAAAARDMERRDQECIGKAEVATLAEIARRDAAAQLEWCDATRDARRTEMAEHFLQSVAVSPHGGEKMATSLAEFLQKNPNAIRQTANNPKTCADRDLGVDEALVAPVINRVSVGRSLLSSIAVNGAAMGSGTDRWNALARDGLLVVRSAQFEYATPFPGTSTEDKSAAVQQAQAACTGRH